MTFWGKVDFHITRVNTRDSMVVYFDVKKQNTVEFSVLSLGSENE